MTAFLIDNLKVHKIEMIINGIKDSIITVFDVF